LFASGKGFTDPQEAQLFVRETGVDWLSVAIGNIHGAISRARRSEKKIEAHLNLAHLARIARSVHCPLVLHGGSGIRKQDIQDGISRGIAKVNIGIAIRQVYEAKMKKSVQAAQQAVYDQAVTIIRDEMNIAGSEAKIKTGSWA